MVCACAKGACKTCGCAKAKAFCTASCHGGAGCNPHCLNTAAATRVKTMKTSDLKKLLARSGISPMGTKDELVRRMVQHLASIAPPPVEHTLSDDDDGITIGELRSRRGAPAPKPKASPGAALIDAIMLNKGYDAAALLSLGGNIVTAESTPAQRKKAYLKLCRKVHPDKNRSNANAKAAFQLLVEALERLANPEGAEEPARKRKKPTRVERSNKGCFKTHIECPRCGIAWGTADLGLEKGAYNFFMMGIKQYVCGRCACRFGCVTAKHTCPLCKGEYEGYDPSQYHRKVNCGGSKGKCFKEGAVFGFHYAKISVRREEAVRKEAKLEAEQRLKRRNAAKRRDARASGHSRRARTDFGGSSASASSASSSSSTAAPAASTDASSYLTNATDAESLFMEGLVDECPRCGGDGGIRPSAGRLARRELAAAHLAVCHDAAAHAKHAMRVASVLAKRRTRAEGEEAQADAAALASWQFGGRQVGQLWMLSTRQLLALCVENELELGGHEESAAGEEAKAGLIAKLAKHLRSKVVMLLTDGSATAAAESAAAFDTATIGQVDDGDLPSNLHALERDELACVAASYGVVVKTGEVKEGIIRALERARFKGSAPLLIGDDG